MTCTSCGDKPKSSSKGFPRAVVEINNPESLVLLRKVVIPASMGTEEDVPPTIGKYFNVLLQYEANGHIYLYSSDGIPTTIEANIPQEIIDRIDNLEIEDTRLHNEIEGVASDLADETTARETADTALGSRIDTVADNLATETANRISADEDLQADIAAEATTRQTADAGLQSQIDAITAGSDVKDIVGTKAELNNYDTSTLGNNDIIKVLQDESENNATTYYRWDVTTQQFTLIGEEGPYYTKSQADTLLNAKQNTLTAGSNVQIVNDTISATDTTYTAGTGLALNGTQFSVDTTTIATQSDLTAGLATKQDTLTAGSNIQISNNTISATDTTYTHFTGATASTDGEQGLVPGPLAGDEGKFLQGDGTWGTPTDTTYTAGTNVQISAQNVISATDTTYTAGANVQISANNEISATDTTYSNFVGTDGQTAGTAGLVPAPATTDAGKFLKADGTWDTAGSAINVVQTTGTSTTDVMSQNATTSLVYADPATRTKIKIGDGAYDNEGQDGVEIGHNAKAGSMYAIGIGSSAEAKGSYSVALGYGAESVANGVSLGRGARAQATSAVAFQRSYTTTQGQVQFELVNAASTEGYNNSKYRLLSGLYDPQSAHDAATKGYVDNSLLGKQDVLTAGSGITIAEESGALVISATGGSSIGTFTTNEWNALWA